MSKLYRSKTSNLEPKNMFASHFEKIFSITPIYIMNWPPALETQSTLSANNIKTKISKRLTILEMYEFET